jgi:hypothetical protein
LDQTWKYSKRSAPSAPVIPVELAGMTLECVVDTGFSGGLLMPFSAFEPLGLLAAIIPDEYVAVVPDSGRVALHGERGGQSRPIESAPWSTPPLGSKRSWWGGRFWRPS